MIIILYIFQSGYRGTGIKSWFICGVIIFLNIFFIHFAVPYGTVQGTDDYSTRVTD